MNQQRAGQPRITVLMAVRNGERYLLEAIDSILDQTFRAFEFIIVDDASTDDTPAILAASAARDDRIVVLRNDRNLGPYSSANLGLQAARAPFVARVDADDVSESDRLAHQLAFLEKHPSCLLVGSGYRSIDAAGKTRFVRHNPLDFGLAAFVARLRMPMVHPSFCFRRIRPDGSPTVYDESYPVAADYALAAALSREGHIASLSAPLVRYRMHAQNISSTRLGHQESHAHRAAAEAVVSHYPPTIATALLEWLSVSYGVTEPSAAALRSSIRGFDAALEHDFGADPPRHVRERAAGLLAEPFLKGPHKLRFLSAFARYGAHHLIPLAVRAGRIQNWLKPSPGPE